MPVSGRKYLLPNEKLLSISNSVHSSMTEDVNLRLIADEQQPGTDVFVTLYYDSRSLYHNLPVVHRFSSTEDNSGPYDQKVVENHRELYDLVACSNKFFVEGKETCDHSVSQSQRYTVNFSKTHYSDSSPYKMNCCDFEYRDSGACFYRNSILSYDDQHQNWFGIIPGEGAVAISLVKTSVYFNSHLPSSKSEDDQSNTKSTDCPITERIGDKNSQLSEKNSLHNGHGTNVNYLPACRNNSYDGYSDNSIHSAFSDNWVIGTVTTPNSQANVKGKKLNKKTSAKTNDASVTTVPEEHSVLQYLMKNENIMDYLKPGVPERSVYEKLLKLDEMELLNNHKFGVLLCRKNQSTEEEMYSNEYSTPAFEEFLNLLGRKVRLRNYSGYIGGLDYRNDSTGSETYVTEFRGSNIVFLVSTLLPYEPSKTEQLARKRHIGNSSVTFIFVEEGAKPFQPDTIISGFQKVFIVVKHVHLEDNKFAYRVAVCREKNVPPFGPIISSDYLFEHHLSFANLLLTKAVNAAYAVLKYSKFREIVQRSRIDYLHQFCKEHILTMDNETLKHGKTHVYRRSSHNKLRQFKNSLKFHGNTIASMDREITPIKYHLDKFSSKNSDTFHKIRQRVKRNHSDVSKSNLNYPYDSESCEEYISLSSTFHNLLDFGQSLYVGLKKWQKIDGWHSVMELLPNTLVTSNEDHTLQNSTYQPPVSNSHYFETQIGISRSWLVIFMPYTISPELANKILMAVPVSSIFAYLFEHNKKVLRIYFEYSNGENILEHLINLVSYSIYPKVLQQCRQTTVIIKNFNHNIDDGAENIQSSDAEVINPINHPKFQKTTSTTNQLNENKPSSDITKRWLLSEIGLRLSCLSPVDDYNSTFPHYTSPYSPSSFSSNPFPYTLNSQNNGTDSYLFKHKNQILLQIGSYHLPELIRILQSRKSSWCLQKLNMSAPFFNLYFPIIYDLHFSTHLLALISKLRFSKNFKVIMCNLPENEILNRARLRCHHHQNLKKCNNNIIKKEIRFSHPQIMKDVNHDDIYVDSDKHNKSDKTRINHVMCNSVHLTFSPTTNVLPNSLPHIIHVSTEYSAKNLQTASRSKDSLTFDENKHSGRNSYSLDVQQIFPSDSYEGSQYQGTTNLVATKINNESFDFTSNIEPTQELIETANYVHSRRRRRKPERMLTMKLNQTDLLTNPSFPNENNQKIPQDEKTPEKEACYHSDQFIRKVTSKDISPTRETEGRQKTNSSTEVNNTSESFSCTINPDTFKNTTDLSLDSPQNLDFSVAHIPVKWRRAKTEKTNSHYQTDAKIITVRRLEATGTHTWHTKNVNATLNRKNKIERRSNNLTVNNDSNIKFTTASVEFIPPTKQKGRLTITKETFTPPQDTWSSNGATNPKCNIETKKNPVGHHESDLTELSENELRSRLQRISEELRSEQTRRNYLANMCANLLEENRKLRTGELNDVNKQQQITTTTTTTTTTISAASTTISTQQIESNHRNSNTTYNKVKLGFINGKIKQISSNPSLWKRSKIKSQKFDNETDL
ncbi:unnamed protein product [Heterobilharzia americana]|nr:unnamed protein product [Heterobilharzia americana]